MLSHVWLETLYRYGREASSFQALSGQYALWQGHGPVVIAYKELPSAYMVVGSPMGSPSHIKKAAQNFEEAAALAGKRVGYFGVEQAFIQNHDCHHICLGEQPVWSPCDWREKKRWDPVIYRQIRRALLKGVEVRQVDILMRDFLFQKQLSDLKEKWLYSKRLSPLGFLLALDQLEQDEHHLYWGAWHQDRLVGFLSLSPIYARKGYLFKNWLRDPQAPNGTIELLIDAGMNAIAQAGCEYATLGLCPLTGKADRVLIALGRLVKKGYNCEGLRRFKEKLLPDSWEPLYLAFPSQQGALSTLWDVCFAFVEQKPFLFFIKSFCKKNNLSFWD